MFTKNFEQDSISELLHKTVNTPHLRKAAIKAERSVTAMNLRSSSYTDIGLQV